METVSNEKQRASSLCYQEGKQELQSGLNRNETSMVESICGGIHVSKVPTNPSRSTVGFCTVQSRAAHRTNWGHRGHLKGNHSQREGRCFLFQQDKGLAFCFLHPNTQRLQELPESVRRAEVTVNLRDKTKQNVKAKKKKKKKSKRKRSGGAKKWPHTFGTRKRHSSTTPPSRGCSLAFSRSRGDSKGAGKAALPAQTRQGNKIFGIRRDFQITKIENSSEVALILGFSLEMSLHP